MLHSGAKLVQCETMQCYSVTARYLVTHTQSRSSALVLAGHVSQACKSWLLADPHLPKGLWCLSLDLYIRSIHFSQELVALLHPQFFIPSTVRTWPSDIPSWIWLPYLELCCYIKLSLRILMIFATFMFVLSTLRGVSLLRAILSMQECMDGHRVFILM